MKWYEEIAKRISKHGDYMAVIRAPKGKAKKRTNRRERKRIKRELQS